MARHELKRAPTHPGEVLKEDFLSPLGLTQVELAKALKTSFRTINEILNEKRSISPDMALSERHSPRDRSKIVPQSVKAGIIIVTDIKTALLRPLD